MGETKTSGPLSNTGVSSITGVGSIVGGEGVITLIGPNVPIGAIGVSMVTGGLNPIAYEA